MMNFTKKRVIGALIIGISAASGMLHCAAPAEMRSVVIIDQTEKTREICIDQNETIATLKKAYADSIDGETQRTEKTPLALVQFVRRKELVMAENAERIGDTTEFTVLFFTR